MTIPDPPVGKPLPSRTDDRPFVLRCVNVRCKRFGVDQPIEAIPTRPVTCMCGTSLPLFLARKERRAA